MTRRISLVLAAAAGVLVMTLAGGIAWAAIPSDDGIIEGCYKKSNGGLRLIDTAEGQTCHSRTEVPISWNQVGPQGDPGVSPTVSQLGQGDPNCPAGGAALTDASGSTAFVCNGQAGVFAGTFTSPNGEYSISVTNTGITLAHGASSVRIVGNDVTVDAAGNLTLRTNGNGLLRAEGELDIHGAVVRIN